MGNLNRAMSSGAAVLELPLLLLLLLLLLLHYS